MSPGWTITPSWNRAPPVIATGGEMKVEEIVRPFDLGDGIPQLDSRLRLAVVDEDGGRARGRAARNP